MLENKAYSKIKDLIDKEPSIFFSKTALLRMQL
jgi:hypothetical protein